MTTNIEKHSAYEEAAVARVVNLVRIHGPIERVFDVVTTTRFWPRWHPATISVGGVTERPIALGDVVRERAWIRERVYEGDWTVVEHARPRWVVLSGRGGRIRIVYAFVPAGPATIFVRELEYHPEDFYGCAAEPAALENLMREQSEAASRNLKRLVEGLLAAGGY